MAREVTIYQEDKICAHCSSLARFHVVIYMEYAGHRTVHMRR